MTAKVTKQINRVTKQINRITKQINLLITKSFKGVKLPSPSLLKISPEDHV